MPQKDLKIRSAVITTKEKLPNQLLLAGKLIYPETFNNIFLFYIIGINCPFASSSKVKKAIIDELETAVKIGITNIGQFESLINNVNEALDKVSTTGDSIWIGRLNAVIGLVNHEQLIMTQTGSISGYIFRGNKISTLVDTSPPSDHPLKTFIDITEGELMPKDRLIFANSTLYDHYSLDRIRQITSNQSAQESILELSRALRKNRIYDVNSIIIEAAPLHAIENSHVHDLPEIIYLDNPDDIWWKNLKKKYGPHLSKLYSKTKDVSRSAGSAIGRHSKNAYQSGRKKWQEKYGPKTKELISKSGHAISQKLKGGKGTRSPQLDKLDGGDKFKTIKVKTNHYQKSASSFVSNAGSFLGTCCKSALNFVKDNQKRKFVYIFAIVILLSIGYLKIRDNNVHRNENKNKQEIALAYDQAKEAYNKAKEDIALGRTNDTTKLEEALALAKKAIENPENKDEARALAVEIQRAIDAITKTTRLYDQKPLFVLNENATRIILVDNDIFGIDNKGKIYRANVKDKESRLIAAIGNDKGVANGMTYSKSDNLLILSTNQAKMIGLDPDSNTQSEITINDTSGKWEDSTAIASYTTNLYILDSESGEIFKHTKNEAGYTRGSSYASTRDTPSIKGSVDLAIDGSIYVLKADGGVAKYNKSVYDSVFALKNMPKNYDKIEQPAKIFTNTDTNYLYILDKKLNRIIKFDKSGEFVGQYSAFDLAIDDFVVNDKIKKMWYLSSGNIYEIDL